MRSDAASLPKPFDRISSLEGVYGAIAYYLANQSDVDAYLIRQGEKWADGKRSAEPLPADLRERLVRAREEIHTTVLS